MSDACGCEKKNQFLAAGERCPSSKRAFRRKSPALAKKTLKEDSFEKDILRKKASPISCFEFRITPSESIDVESGDDFDPDVNQNFLNPATGVFEEEVYEDARSDFDKDILAQLNINYDLPSDPNARQSWINRVKNLNGARTHKDKIDPFRFFEVEQEPCHLLKVNVLRGRNISKGMFGDLIDIPDPYVVIHVRAAPDGRQKTTHRDNDVNPEWNESFEFLLPSDPNQKINAEITLMDSNLTMDETYGTVEMDITALPVEEEVIKSFRFNETSEIDVKFYKERKYGQDLRSSLALCADEKAFRSMRKRRVKDAMSKLMESKGFTGPRVLREIPTIAVLGSGGGFRAMTGYAGAIKALSDSGILDCCTYVTGLSGSSWYLATLYANEEFPHKGTETTKEEIRKNIESSPFWLLKPDCVLRYSNNLHAKMKSGQPVTFTDFFGMLIGQTLLGPEKMQKSKLSDFHEKIKDGIAPMPVMTCLHVRPRTSAMTFHDWVEFTPYEIGMAKYGTFMNSKHFGSKFFMGVLAKVYEESPLHFLMGVWGSAFSILFNRLLDKGKKIVKCDDKSDDIRQEMESELSAMKQTSNYGESDSDSDFDSDTDDAEYKDAEESLPEQNTTKESKPGVLSSIWNWGFKKADSFEEPLPSSPPKKERRSKRKRGFLPSLVASVFGADLIESREYRAGKILNYMRGLSLSKTYPLSPFTPLVSKTTIAEEHEFLKLHEPIEVRKKKVHLVDAGLTFNSPFPPMLRPQRAVDLIISFDFSKRPGEDVDPFKEIKLAEKWARLHELPFPVIDRSRYDKEGMKECYVFKDDTNERAPIIIHFVLCNVQFRKFSKPGVPRHPDDKSGDFNVFDDPKSPYSTFNFQYANEAFDRLHDLTEFNTLLHVDTIIDEIMACIKLRRHSHARGSITLNDIRNSIHLSAKNRKSLETTLLNKGEENRFFSIDQ